MGQAGALLVGRAVEQRALAVAREQAADAPALVLVVGEAGIGKSWLVADTAAAAAELGWRVLTGHCLPLSGGGLPYGPWTDVLRQLRRTLGREVFARLLGDDAAALSPLLPLAPAASSPPTAHVLEALLSLVERLAEERPLLLGLEDLHWAELSSLDALAFLLRNLPAVPVLVTATSRSDEVMDPRACSLLDELRRQPRVSTVELAPLGVDATAELIAALGGDPQRAAELHAHAGGNPFYLGALVAAGPRPLTHLQDAVLARLDGLPAGARWVLQALAVADRPVPQALLEQVTRLPNDELTRMLHALADRRLLATVHAAHAPVHRLAAEAVLSAMLPGERADLHRAYADALERDPAALGDGPAVLALARHRAEGCDAAAALRAAAAAALSGQGYAATARWARAALDRWSDVPEAEAVAGCSRGELLAHAAEATLHLGHPVDAVALARASLDEPDAADPQVGGGRGERLAHYLWSAGRTREAAEANQRALALLGEQPSLALARARASWSSTLMVLGQWDEAQGACRAAIATAEQVGAAVEAAHARATLGVVLVSRGESGAGLRELEQAAEQARGTGNVRLLWRNLLNASYAHTVGGSLERSAALAQEALELAQRHGLEAADVRAAVTNAASALVDLGRWDSAERLLQAAPAGAPDDPRVRLLERVAAALAVARGQSLDDRVLEGHEDEPRMRQQRDQVRADRALWAGDPAAALLAVEEGLACEGSTLDAARLRVAGLRAAADLLELPVGAGGPGTRDRPELLRRVQAWAEWLPAQGPPELHALALQARAEAERARGTATPSVWEPVVAAWDAAERPFPAAVARWRLAASLAARRERPDAPLQQAYDVAVRLGAAPLRRELELLALRTRTAVGVPTTVPAQAGPLDHLSLTRRERQVLELLATGASNRRIGRQLSITENTAGVHVSNVLRKLGVANRSEATAVAHRLGLAPVEGGTP